MIVQPATLIRWHREAFHLLRVSSAPSTATWPTGAMGRGYRATGVTVTGARSLRTPDQVPVANAHCELLLGNLCRAHLDLLFPFVEPRLRRFLRAWKVHHYRGRPHSGLGPGPPAPPPGLPATPIVGHDLPQKLRVVARPILGGLDHGYGLEKLAG
jgi:hypothetical protein